MIQFIFTSGVTLYIIIIDPFTSKVWNTVSLAWEDPIPANWSKYVIQMSEFTGTGIYYVSFPLTISAAASYGIGIYQLLGANLSLATPTGDNFVGDATFGWDGTAQTLFLTANIQRNVAPTAHIQRNTALTADVGACS